MATSSTNGAPQARKKLPAGSLFGCVLLAAGLVIAAPVHASGSTSGAEKLRRLDIMLMVTSLRCRTTSDDFVEDYGRFTKRHLRLLNQAHEELGADLRRRHGSSGATRAMDRLSVHMANSYGHGHPWLDCKELKNVARRLAQVRERAVLVEAADQLRAPRRSPQFAFGAR